MKYLVQHQGMVHGISTDRVDQIGAKIKTPKTWGFLRKPKAMITWLLTHKQNPYPIYEQNDQTWYPISDQNGSKNISF